MKISKKSVGSVAAVLSLSASVSQANTERHDPNSLERNTRDGCENEISSDTDSGIEASVSDSLSAFLDFLTRNEQICDEQVSASNEQFLAGPALQ
ncbi:MAG: hypothetical protein HRU19_32035 [Pseudobacteriovorax sp.]|nr:hypothetical protein [Pseudobacteriovorax sp.]